MNVTSVELFFITDTCFLCLNLTTCIIMRNADLVQKNTANVRKVEVICGLHHVSARK